VLRDGKLRTGTFSCGAHRCGMGLLGCFNCQHPNLQMHKWSTHPVHNHLAHVTFPLAHSLSSIVVPLACILSTVQPLVIFAPHRIRRFFCGHDCFGSSQSGSHAGPSRCTVCAECTAQSCKLETTSGWVILDAVAWIVLARVAGRVQHCLCHDCTELLHGERLCRT
jgi:hypothetical protein